MVRWLEREEYDSLVTHGYAGPGAPLAPGAGGFWLIEQDSDGATVLVTGVHVRGLSLPYEERTR